jgi:ribose/xylose/arabinose/galactoside ABC-type transport system permease subunit
MTITKTTDSHELARSSGTGGASWRGLAAYITVAGMILVLAGITVAKPQFLSVSNIDTILVDTTVLLVLAIGLTLVMSMKGIDLSVAATADLTGYVAAILLASGRGVVFALAAALIIGIVAGAVNGVLSGYLGVPAIVSTLGTNLLLTAVALVVSNNMTPIQLFTSSDAHVAAFLAIGNGSLGPVRYLVLIALVITAIAWFFTKRTVWGRRVDLIESNARAAFLAGVPVRATFAIGFVASGALAAIAGIMLTARTGVAVPGNATSLLLSAFTAVYLGSVASPKGRISVLWTVVGVLFVSALSNGLILLGFGAPWRTGLNGLLILLALALSALRRHQASSRGSR